MAMSYGHVYVARVAFGAKDAQTVKAFREAEAYPGPSLIIAYSHCIAHGYDMALRAASSRSSPSTRASGRSTASTRAASRGASRRSSSTRARRRRRSSEYMQQREPLPHGRGRRSRALQASSPRASQAAARRLALYRHLSAWKPLPRRPRSSRRTATPAPRTPPASRRRSEMTMDLSTTYLGFELPHPFMPGASPLVDDLDTVRRLEDAGAAAIVMHSLFEEQIVGERARDLHAPATRTSESLRRGDVVSARARRCSPSARTTTSSRSQRIKSGRRGARHRVAERHDARGLARVRAPDRAGGRRRARAQRLRARDRSARDRARTSSERTLDGGRAPSARRSRSRSRSSCRRSTRRSRTWRGASSAPARRARLFNRFYQPDIDAENARGRAAAAPLELLRAAPAPALARDPVGPLSVLARRHRRRPQRPRRGQGDHGRRARGADGLGLATKGPGDARTSRGRSGAVAGGARVRVAPADAGQHEPMVGAPNPAAFERANYMRILQSWRPDDA